MTKPEPTTAIARRTLLGAAAVGLGAFAAPAILRAAPQIEQLSFFGPPAGPSITLAHAVARSAFSAIAAQADFTPWKDPDELRAGLTSGTMQVVIVPANAAANLYNRGFGVRLVNVMTNGLTYVLTFDPKIARPADLAGRTVAMPFRNDTPDILLRRLLAAAHVPADALKIAPSATPIEAAQLLLSGRADAAVLPEPAATLVEMRAAETGRKAIRAIDIRTAWSALTGFTGAPQAGLAVANAFEAAHPDAVAAIQAALEATLPDVLSDPEGAAASAATALGMPAAVLARAIPHCALVADRASAARPALEAMFREVLAVDPRAIGDRLPDDGFYAL